MQKSNTGFYISCAVIITFASLFYTYKYIVPTYQKTQGDIYKIDKEILAGKEKIDSLQTTKSSLDQLGELVNRLFVAIPEDKDTPNLITEIEAIGTKAGVDPIPAIQISDSSSSTVVTTDSAASVNPNAVTVSFTVSGTFAQLTQMITSLEKDVRFTNINTLNFTTAKDDKLTLAVQMQVFKRVVAALPATVTPVAN